MFAVYAFLASTLSEVTKLEPSLVPQMFGIFGAGLTTGNLVAPAFADEAPLRSTGGVLLWSMAALFLYPVMAHSPVLIAVDVFLIGCSQALGVVLQTRLMEVSDDAQALPAALNHSAFNIAIALGPLVAGVARLGMDGDGTGRRRLASSAASSSGSYRSRSNDDPSDGRRRRRESTPLPGLSSRSREGAISSRRMFGDRGSGVDSEPGFKMCWHEDLASDLLGVEPGASMRHACVSELRPADALRASPMPCFRAASKMPEHSMVDEIRALRAAIAADRVIASPDAAPGHPPSSRPRRRRLRYSSNCLVAPLGSPSKSSEPRSVRESVDGRVPTDCTPREAGPPRTSSDRRDRRPRVSEDAG